MTRRTAGRTVASCNDSCGVAAVVDDMVSIAIFQGGRAVQQFRRDGRAVQVMCRRCDGVVLQMRVVELLLLEMRVILLELLLMEMSIDNRAIADDLQTAAVVIVALLDMR